MTPYHEVFVPIFLLGILIAGALSLFAGMRSGCLLPGILLVGGTLALWAAIFGGADMGYRAWQKMPDPPDEAFSDASVLGAFILGWLPASMFCIFIFGTVRSFRWLLHWANPDVFPRQDTAPVATAPEEPTDSKNPYQSPRISR